MFLVSGIARAFKDLVDDFRDLAAELKKREGQGVFLLLVVTLGAAAALFFFALGFDRLSDITLINPRYRPFQCRSPGDMASVFIVIGGVVFALLAVVALGEAMLFIDRKRRGLPGRVGAVIGPAVAVIAVAALGALGMRMTC